MTEGSAGHQAPAQPRGGGSPDAWVGPSSAGSDGGASGEEKKDEAEEPGDQDGEAEVADGCGQQVAPEGGWGWVVVLANVLVLALTLAFPSCIGIFYTELQAEFSASNSETSWVPAIMTALLHGGGPLCSVLVELYGCRPTVIVGGVLSGLGMAASTFAQSITELYITAAVTGLGLCLTYQPSVTMTGLYFVRRRAFANALSSTGTALGLTALPLLANFLLSRFGWRGGFLVLGGVLLNCCVCGAVLRPPRLPLKPGSGRRRRRSDESSNISSVPQQKKGLKGRLRAALLGVMAFLQRHMAFDLIHSNTRYRACAVGMAWMMLGFLLPLVYLVPYATAHGMKPDRAALLMSILGVVNIIMRPAAALVLGLPRFQGSRGFVYLFAAAILVNGLSNCICGVASNFTVLLVYVIIFGLSMSFIGSLMVTVLMDNVEMSRFPSALGLLSVMQGVAALISPPFAGMLVDKTGRYTYVFYACSVSGTGAAVFITCSFYYLDRQRTKKAKRPPGSPARPLKSIVSLAAACEYRQVPSDRGKAADKESEDGTDV
ncbi:monocarboxylate transporter 6 [Denticeps clupeoides]|uniref:Major facilitator superfamily (MFS) profile domain-containing protein n=1 Tax=Denticeps clupeoides TaxID=299321 RepID=A0AAY4BJK2_9TELE|nr:monocarboxylate transporter 6-like [Denticeps clupeoides]XP_028842357.1 monocarboxylate transporter 6-like [Denticeps clupeoides]